MHEHPHRPGNVTTPRKVACEAVKAAMDQAFHPEQLEMARQTGKGS